MELCLKRSWGEEAIIRKVYHIVVGVKGGIENLINTPLNGDL